MPATYFTSADLLARLRREIRMPANADYPATADLYAWLSQGQINAMLDLSTVAPKANIGGLIQMVTADGGFTYTFGTSDSNNLYPLGAVAIYRLTTDAPDFPMVEGVDYLMEGDTIRSPNGRAFSLPGSPYWQGMTIPPAMDAATEPTMKPAYGRLLAVYDAAMQYAEDNGSDSSVYEKKYARARVGIVKALQLQYKKSGAIGATNPMAGPARSRWWRVPRSM